MLKKIKAMLNGKTKVESVDKKHDISLAVTALMVEIMHSDDVLDKAEHNVIIKAVSKRFDLSDSEVETLIKKAKHTNTKATDFHQFTSQIKDGFSTEERIDFLKELWLIAMADGVVDSYEEHLIRRIANLIGVYHGEFIQAKIQARNSSQGTE